MSIKNVIVQASGKGSRLEEFTFNKPKALVSIFGKPLLYHLKDAFPDAKFYIIGDYKYDVLKTYLEINKPPFDYEIIKSEGEGSCQGLKKTINLIKKNSELESFALTWCDLLYKKPIKINIDDNYIGLTNNFECRWQYLNNCYVEKKGKESGIFGLFLFKNDELLKNLPDSGEFVKFLASNKIKLKPFFVEDVLEIGTKEVLLKLKESEPKSRFFNKISIHENVIIKECVNNQFEKLLVYEINWYKFVKALNYKNVPKLLSIHPLTLEKIDGKHPFELEKLNDEEKNIVVKKILSSLNDLHKLSYKEYDEEECFLVYVKKTKDRLMKIKNIIPYVNESKFYIINSNRVINLLYNDNIDLINEIFSQIKKSDKFTLIHGDPTFSNTLIKEGHVYFIDPRGYFGKKELYGDPLYDFAKVFYSVKGNYDKFNRHKFYLKIDKKDDIPEVDLRIQSNNFENSAKIFSEIFDSHTLKSIKVLHALIWLSLTGYVLDNVDSIIGAYFKGLEELNEFLN